MHRVGGKGGKLAARFAESWIIEKLNQKQKSSPRFGSGVRILIASLKW